MAIWHSAGNAPEHPSRYVLSTPPGGLLANCLLIAAAPFVRLLHIITCLTCHPPSRCPGMWTRARYSGNNSRQRARWSRSHRIAVLNAYRLHNAQRPRPQRRPRRFDLVAWLQTEYAKFQRFGFYGPLYAYNGQCTTMTRVSYTDGSPTASRLYNIAHFRRRTRPSRAAAAGVAAWHTYTFDPLVMRHPDVAQNARFTAFGHRLNRFQLAYCGALTFVSGARLSGPSCITRRARGRVDSTNTCLAIRHLITDAMHACTRHMRTVAARDDGLQPDLALCCNHQPPGIITTLSFADSLTPMRRVHTLPVVGSCTMPARALIFLWLMEMTDAADSDTVGVRLPRFDGQRSSYRPWLLAFTAFISLNPFSHMGSHRSEPIGKLCRSAFSLILARSFWTGRDVSSA